MCVVIIWLHVHVCLVFVCSGVEEPIIINQSINVLYCYYVDSVVQTH